MNTLPKKLQDCPFCVWKKVRRNGKMSKVPYSPLTGKPAKTDTPETFSTYWDALKALEVGKYDGLGILVANGVAAFDIDHCLENSQPDELAASILEEFKDCYVEVSPSGTGLRGFFTVPDGYAYNRDAYYIKHGGLEIYLPGMTNRFVTVTGNVYRAGDVVDETAALEKVLEKHMKRPDAHTELPSDFTPHSYLSDEEALSKARKNPKFADCFDGEWNQYYSSQSEADLFVLGCLAFYCGGDMEQMERVFSGSSLMREKFANDLGLTAYGLNTMKKAVAGRSDFYDPHHRRSTAEEDFGSLAALINSSPDVDALYDETNLRLAVSAMKTKPADYEKLRAIVQKNGMSLQLWEREVKKTAEVVENEEQVMQYLLENVVEKPDFVVTNSRTKAPMVDPAKLAIHVHDRLHYMLVVDSLRDTRTKYVYEDGVYRLCSDERFKGHIKSFIEAYNPELVRMKDVEEAFKNLSTGLEAIPFDQLNPDENIINFQNGLLHLDDMTLWPHDPEVCSTIQLDCEWPEQPTPTPVFDAYLATLTDYDVALQTLLLQFMGVVLSNVHGDRYKKALFLSGPGDTGKSQLKLLTERILGRDNFAAIDLPELEGQFGASMIYGKRLVGTADMTFLTIRELKTFKNATGGDNIRMEFKGKTGFSYKYHGLLWFCMNKLPLFGGDNGDWVYDRIMLVHCPNTIAPSKQDHKLLDKMYEERDGIVYKAVMALKETITNGYRFTEPAYVSAARTEYKEENSPIIQFIKECMEPREVVGKIEKVDHDTVTSVHRIFSKWCVYNNNGFTKTKKEFIEGYCRYMNLTKDLATIRRGQGVYFAHMRVKEEAYGNLLPSDSEVHRTLILGA